MNNIKFKDQGIIVPYSFLILGAITLCLISGCKSTQIIDHQSKYSIDNSENYNLADSHVTNGELKPLLAQANILNQNITEQEKISILDKKLEKSIAEFDKMFAIEIMKMEIEKDKISSETSSNSQPESVQENANARSESQSKSTSSVSDASIKGDGEESAKEKGYGGNMANVTDGSTPSQGGLLGSGKNSETPIDVPNGEDDDIIARQIREAAINEKDPRLKVKLWDEYRKYKGGQ